MNPKYCLYCGEEIHPMRLEILPKTKTCVKCSTVKTKRAELFVSKEGDDVEVSIKIIDNPSVLPVNARESYDPFKE